MIAKKKRGRQVGYRKAGGLGAKLPPIRVTAEQIAKLDALPGVSLADKLRRWLDSAPEVKR